MSDLDEKNEITKEEFAANEIKAFCAYVMHPDSDLHKDAEDWIKERLQANDVNSENANCAIFGVVNSVACDFCGQPSMEGKTHCEKCACLRVI